MLIAHEYALFSFLYVSRMDLMCFMRYHSTLNLENVLALVSSSKSSVGQRSYRFAPIVGRTGSGKVSSNTIRHCMQLLLTFSLLQSSLTLSLLRCIITEGNVYYDGIPISSLNLDSLRSNVTIIPQMVECHFIVTC
jgi:hypothetical protein